MKKKLLGLFLICCFCSAQYFTYKNPYLHKICLQLNSTKIIIFEWFFFLDYYLVIMMELEPRVALLQDLRLQTFDSIRFASYRTASKLRYIQKSTNLHLVDIWNVIEAFRENGLNTLEPQSDVSVARLETLVSSLYHNLNKRLPTAQQVPVDSKAGLLLNWLLAAYTR